MKRRLLSALAILAIVLSILTPQSVQAASAKSKVKKLVANMSTYEYALLFETKLSAVGEKYEIVLTDAEMARAAAFTAPLNDDTYIGEVGEHGWEYIYSVSTSLIKKMSKKMFGKAISYKKLPKGSWDKVPYFIDVYRNDDGKPEFYIWDGETETDFETIKQTIKKSGKGFTVTRDVFFGYWGINEQNNHKASNYRITYTVEKNKASSYGYVITKMVMERTADLNLADED
ncbi:MAG: hypothetical protein K6G45_13115 [Lachnospiraceae bacterium]|nr:hypothetical protein [Lachnospiraceae bacterium]